MAEAKIGKFMIGVGCLLEHTPTGKILCVRREGSDFQKGEWEIPYGRIDQHEELFAALHREMFEETGITDFNVKRLLRIWHFYRGTKSAETEIHGFTFHCTTQNQDLQLSSEHSEFAWLSPAEAASRITVPGIKMDVQIFMDKTKADQVAFSQTAQSMDTLMFL